MLISSPGEAGKQNKKRLYVCTDAQVWLHHPSLYNISNAPISREHPQNVHKADERANKSDLDLVTAAHCLFFKMKCSHDEAFCGGNNAERGAQLIRHE